MDQVDVVWDLEEFPWPFSDESAEGIIMHHVIEHLDDIATTFSELVRILEPGGWISVTYPFGVHWFRDPTHQQYWTYTTPEYYAMSEDNEWDYYFDHPLVLENRSFSTLWICLPIMAKISPVLRLLAKRYPGDWVCFTPWVAGEITAEFRKIST